MSCCVIFLFRLKVPNGDCQVFCLVWFWAGQVFCFGSGFVSVWKTICLRRNMKKKRVERFCFGLLSLLGLELTRPEPNCCQHFDFFYLSSKKREREKIFFFNWVALASFCVLKIDFLFMLEHSTSFNNRLVSDSFFSSLFVYDLFCFGFAQNETKNETRFFVSWREEKNGAHLFHWN